VSLDSFTRKGNTFPVIDLGVPNRGVIILVHGFPSDATSMTGLARGLADLGYRVLVPELRGYTPSANPSHRWLYRIKELTDDVTALAKAADVERFHYMGHDWGGLLGWYISAAKRPELSSFTALGSPHPRAFLKALLRSRQILYSWYMLFFQIPVLPEWILLRRGGSLLRQSLVNRDLPPASVDAAMARFLSTRTMLRGALDWYRAMPIDILRTLTLGPSLAKTLYVYGDKDEFSTGTANQDMEKWIGGDGKISVIEGADHWLPEKSVAEVVTAFAAFQSRMV
jgi:pimeloyl-ACP methyl ester carboxylesterase